MASVKAVGKLLGIITLFGLRGINYGATDAKY